MATSKLEMSLDEIIDAQKRKGQAAVKKPVIGKKVARKSTTTKKRLQRNRVTKFNRKSFGAGRFVRTLNNNKKAPKMKRVGMIKRQSFASAKNARIKKNRNIVLVAKNLVNKLVKKAIAQNMPIVPVTIPPSKRQIRVRANRLRQRTILNRIGAYSRTIDRPRVVTTPLNSPVFSMQNVKNRVPIRFNTQLPAFQLAASAPSRIITATHQRILQQPQSYFSTPRRHQSSFNITNMNQLSSVRAQINAMRRASRVQQLQNQFVIQQQPIQKFVQHLRGRRQLQQVLVSRPPSHTKYILFQQQNPRQQFIRIPNNMLKNSTRFARRQKHGFRGQSRGQFSANAFYDPPNFLQRI